MKIAIPTDNGINICPHFGRTKAFRIVEIDNKKVIHEEYRENNFTGHAQGHYHEHDKEHNHAHSHEGIFSALNDCETIIANGMGRRLYDEFNEKQIKVFVTKETIITNAIIGFIDNSLDNSSETCCNH